MEQLQETIPIPSRTDTSLVLKSLYLRFGFILMLGFSLTNIGVTMFSRSIKPVLASPNPFLEYANMFLGQPISLVKGEGIVCWKNHAYNDSFEPICRLPLPSGVFSSINLFVSDGIIRQISFFVRDNTLKAGDLVLLFGKPDFYVYRRNVFFFWSNLFVNVSTSDGGAAPMRPVWCVTFTPAA